MGGESLIFTKEYIYVGFYAGLLKDKDFRVRLQGSLTESEYPFLNFSHQTVDPA